MVKLLSMIALLLWFFADGYGQTINLNKKVNINYRQQTLKTVLNQLEKQYQLSFSYSSSLLPLQKKVTLQVKNQTLKSALKKLFRPIHIRFALIGNQIVLKKEKKVVASTPNKPSANKDSAQKPKKYVTINILDASTSNPVPQVHIIHYNSIMIGNSDSKGLFRLQLQSDNEFELKFSHVSYETTRLTINPLIQLKYNIWMIPKIEKLTGITISSKKDKRWKKLFNKFKNDFLGTSSNALQCKILNPWVVEFVETPLGITLKKNSSDTLEIENYALGYKVLFLLGRFDLANDDVHYKGRCWFSELTPRNNKQIRRWKRNRERAYNGSFKHFLTTLANNTYLEEGYEILYSKEAPSIVMGQFFTAPIQKIVKKNGNPNQFVLYTPHYMRVVYNGEREEYNYIKWYKKNNPWVRGFYKPRHQSSWVWLNSEKIVFDAKGNILNKADKIIRYGYWAWERVGEMLPYSYIKETEENITKSRKK